MNSSGDRATMERRATAIWAVVLLAAQILFYAKWWDWSGDDSWGPRFLIPGVMAGLLVVASMDLGSKRGRISFALLAVAGIIVELPAVLLGPHESLLLTHFRQPVAIVNAAGARQFITRDEDRFNPLYSQVTATMELLELKCTGRVPHSFVPAYIGTRWAESFDPPLRASEIHFDIFWIHPRRRDGKGADIRSEGIYGHAEIGTVPSSAAMKRTALEALTSGSSQRGRS